MSPVRAGTVPAPLSISRLARRFGLSRSTLLYYDRVGLLSPSARSAAGYRLYGARDAKRLEAICRYRGIGLELAGIRGLLDEEGRATRASRTAQLLEARLVQLNAEVERLREQQRVIVGLLARPGRLGRARVLDKRGWVAILRASGLDDAAMHRWHVEFERMAPDAHREFLESLGIPKPEVARIRRWSRRV
jgi:MerR family transcriptional regulator, thiopeptide resistance regulator